MIRAFEEYQHAYRHVAMTREDGVLELRLHTDGGPLVWGDGPHSELGRCFWDVGSDPANRVIILTGTGNEFIGRLDDSWVGAMTPEKWNRIFTNGKRLLQALLDIEVPVIGAVNGKATVHAELALLSDIVRLLKYSPTVELGMGEHRLTFSNLSSTTVPASLLVAAPPVTTTVR